MRTTIEMSHRARAFKSRHTRRMDDDEWMRAYHVVMDEMFRRRSAHNFVPSQTSIRYILPLHNRTHASNKKYMSWIISYLSVQFRLSKMRSIRKSEHVVDTARDMLSEQERSIVIGFMRAMRP